MLVPTRAAGDELRRTLERQLLTADRPALAVPHLATRGDFLLLARQRLASPPDLLSPFDREVILRSGAVAAEAAGFVPPFTVRPGLVAEMLALYDALRRHRRTVARFEEFLTEELAHSDDRGAARLLAQTGFLAETWRQYDACLDARGVDDEHRLRDRLIAEPAAAPIRRVIVTVTDRIADPAGLWPSDLDLLTRLPGLAHIDVVATEARLGGGWLERLAELLPGFEELSVPAAGEERAICLVPSADAWVFTSRDREEELAGVRAAPQSRATGRPGRRAVARGPGRSPAVAVSLPGARRAGPRRHRLRRPRHAAPGGRAVRGGARPGPRMDRQRLHPADHDRPAALAALPVRSTPTAWCRRAPPSPRSTGRWPTRATWATPIG